MSAETFARLREKLVTPEVIEKAHQVGLTLADDPDLDKDGDWFIGGGAITYGMVTAAFDAAVAALEEEGPHA